MSLDAGVSVSIALSLLLLTLVFLCMSVLSTCMYPCRPEEGIRSPGTGVIVGLGVCFCWESFRDPWKNSQCS